MIGLGIDIVEIARMRAILKRSPAFRLRAFSDGERAYCEGCAASEVHYAMRFAAKEAVVKALGTGFSRGVGVRDVEICCSAEGKPFVILSGCAQDIAYEQGFYEFSVSLSCTDTNAVACAVAIPENFVLTQKEQGDIAGQLTRSFDELQGACDKPPSA